MRIFAFIHRLGKVELNDRQIVEGRDLEGVENRQSNDPTHQHLRPSPTVLARCRGIVTEKGGQQNGMINLVPVLTTCKAQHQSTTR